MLRNLNDFVLVGFRESYRLHTLVEDSPKYVRCVGTVHLVIVKLIELYRLQNFTALNKDEE
jgi:hypothetical protein